MDRIAKGKEASVSKTKKPRLGRGLSSLMGSAVSVAPLSTRESAGPVSEPVESGRDGSAPGGLGVEIREAGAGPGSGAGDEAGLGLRYIAVEAIGPNPHQPRQTFDSDALERLAASIRQDGVMQPIVLRPSGEAGRYELVAGERRWRAAQLAQLERVPALVRELSDQQVAEWALIENLQREDLDPIERARAFRGLAEEFGLSHDKIAERVGIERPTVTNSLRLLELPESIQLAVKSRQLSAGHARALLGLGDAQVQALMGDRAIRKGWSVRQVEQAVREALGGEPRSTGAGEAGSKAGVRRSPHVVDLERQLASELQTKVHLKPGRKKGTGVLSIEYYSLDQFDSLLARMGVDLGA